MANQKPSLCIVQGQYIGVTCAAVSVNTLSIETKGAVTNEYWNFYHF